MELQHKKAWINGGSKGIGYASAYKLAEMGADITLSARNEDDLKSAVASLPLVHPAQKHDWISVDVGKMADFQAKVIQKIAESDKPYLILVNNTAGPAAGLIQNAKAEEFTDTFSKHLIVNHFLAMQLLPQMKEKEFGRIVNIISTSVKVPLQNLGVSNTVRAAVANWAKTLASEVAQYGITVNNVLPGATATDRLAAIISGKAEKLGKSFEEVEAEMLSEIPARRFAKPKEVANAVGFLASVHSGYITGINIPVDGGRTGCL